MLKTRRKIAWAGVFVLLLLLAACGGDNNMQSSSNNNGSSPSPGSSNTGGGSGGSGMGGGTGGSGGGGSSSPYFVAALLSSDNSSNHGQITLSTTGTGTVNLQSVAATQTYAVMFCQFPNGTSNCFSVGSVKTDASGNAQSSFTFGKSGTWVGVFSLQPTSGGTNYNSSFPTPSTPNQFLSPLVKGGDVTGGLPSFWQPVGTDPFTSGSLTVNGSVAQITLTGAAANATYTVSFCANGGGSSCFADLGTVMTDANGNGTGTAQTNNYNPPGVFSIGRNGSTQFVTGVKVP